MHVPPIVAECLERPDIQAKLPLANTPEKKVALAEEVHGLLPFAIGVVVKKDFIADVLDQQTMSRVSGVTRS